jgi:hypothetical protein
LNLKKHKKKIHDCTIERELRNNNCQSPKIKIKKLIKKILKNKTPTKPSEVVKTCEQNIIIDRRLAQHREPIIFLSQKRY